MAWVLYMKLYMFLVLFILIYRFIFLFCCLFTEASQCFCDKQCSSEPTIQYERATWSLAVTNGILLLAILGLSIMLCRKKPENVSETLSQSELKNYKIWGIIFWEMIFLIYTFKAVLFINLRLDWHKITIMMHFIRIGFTTSETV